MLKIPTDDFLSTEEFAQEITITSGASSYSVKGIFQEPGAILTPGGVEVITTDPTILCATSDVEDYSEGDSVVINSVTYYLLRPHEPDGWGFSLLYLSRNDPGA